MKFSDLLNSANGRKLKAPMMPMPDTDGEVEFYKGFASGCLAMSGTPVEQVPEKIQTLKIQVEGLRQAQQQQPQYPQPQPQPIQAELMPPSVPALPEIKSVAEQADKLRRRK